MQEPCQLFKTNNFSKSMTENNTQNLFLTQFPQKKGGQPPYDRTSLRSTHRAGFKRQPATPGSNPQ